MCKKKALYFIKRKEEAVSKEGIKTALIYGDLSYNPLEQLSALVDEVSVAKKKRKLREKTLKREEKETH